ncbi:ABC transporter substrate-binding protein [Solwaraspora sp. WMMD1047]|uniref:ABC transporter substrate-binding protein n=1 Tax=Solwaraspora sp. WMMD1047 TaxID=3016102 RepID=UPI002415EB33|nr:ABC transporter substrate-binding protein [Solwaraspora sp. WMMD1047]MDG4833942.1 ABC transporter substrate-binding protein [Solwaraspora sp. WMMD1047]
MINPRRSTAAVLVSLLALAGCTSTSDSAATGASAAAPTSTGPVTVTSCQRTIALDAPPQRIFAVFHPAIELAHALGAGDRLVGTAFLDNQILPEYAAAQATVPYNDDYPSKERLYSLTPDFVLSAFNDAFTPDVLGSQNDLAAQNINSYVFGEWCPAAEPGEGKPLQLKKATFETTYTDITQVGVLLGAPDRAADIIARMKAVVDDTRTRVRGADTSVTVAVGTLRDDGTISVQGGSGITQEIIEIAGGTNAYADIATRQASVSVEDFVRRDPDVIVLAPCCGKDMTVADGQKEVDKYTAAPALADVTAVRDKRFIVVPFPGLFSGIRNADTAAQIARALHPDRF